MKQDVITLKKKQFNRYRLIQEVIDGQLTAKDAAEALNLSIRQIQRLKKQVKANGTACSYHLGMAWI